MSNSRFCILIEFSSLTIESLKSFDDNPENCYPYDELRDCFNKFGFTKLNDYMYIGNSNITAVDCVLVTQYLNNKFKWFKPAVRNFKMLRVEDTTDLLKAI